MGSAPSRATKVDREKQIRPYFAGGLPAFSEAVSTAFGTKSARSLLLIVVVSLHTVGDVIAITNVFVARKCGFHKADEIAHRFSCVRKASTIPMGHNTFCFRRRGAMVLPLIYPPDPTDGWSVAGTARKRQTEVTGAAVSRAAKA